jgi:hypothetical protein
MTKREVRPGVAAQPSDTTPSRPPPLLVPRRAKRGWLPAGPDASPWLDKRTLVAATVVLVVLALGWPIVLAAVVVAFVHLRLGPRAVFQSLAAVVIIKFLNDAIFRFPPLFGLLAWALLFAAAARVIGMLNRRAMTVLVPLWTFVLVVAVLTPFASANPAVSWFKLLAFLIGGTTVIAAAYALSDENLRLLRAWLPSVVLAVAVLSLLTFPFPGISYRIAPHLFQGVLNHSQALGAFLAPLATLLGARWLFHRRAFTKLDGLFFLLVAVLVIATNARTAVIAVMLGIGGSVLLGLVRDRRSRQESARGLVAGTALAVLGLVAALAIPQVRDGVVGFVFKSGSEASSYASVEEAFMASRGTGLAGQWQNFLDHPVMGTGFGVYPKGTKVPDPVTVMGIPISSPVEKGFLPTAVLEEVGILGALVFLALVVALVRESSRAGDPVWVAVLLTCLFVNLGEAVFFSMGGLGLVFWLWIGLAIRGVAPQPGGPGRSVTSRTERVRGRAGIRDNILR